VFRKEREVGEAAEPPKLCPKRCQLRLLAEQHGAEPVGVAHDRVGAEVTEVLRQLTDRCGGSDRASSGELMPVPRAGRRRSTR